MSITKLIICFFSFFIIACSNKEPDVKFDNYLYRLKNALDISDAFLEKQPAFIHTEQSLLRYPQKRDLNQLIPPVNINLIDFLRLSSCDLQRHIGQRNSSLGKLMKPSQQLLYEYEFMRLATLCQQQLTEEDELYPILLTAIQEKQSHLAKVQANAVFASDEFKTFFSLSAPALSIDVLQTSPQTLSSALDTLNQFVQHPPKSAELVEEAYAVIGSSKRLGELRHSMALVKRYLARADILLNYRIDHKPLCLPQGVQSFSRPFRNPQFEIVNTVFMKFYIGDIQPYLATLHQYAETLFLQIEKLRQQQLSPPAFEHFWASVYTNETSEWQQFTQAVKTHTRHWQMLLQQCGRLPS